MSTDRKVVFTQNYLDGETTSFLRSHGCCLESPALPEGVAERNLSEDQLVELLQEAQGWIVGHPLITRSLLKRLPDLKVIARRGVGYERVDVQAVRDLGRVLAIGAGGNDASVADHTLGLILSVGSRLRDSQRRMEEGDWRILPSHDLNGKTVGILGFGRIAKSVVRRLSGFDARVLVCTRSPVETPDVTFVDFETLLRESDVLTLHAPLNENTRHIINGDTLARMKPGAILVNTARGGLVDDRALLSALESGQLLGAGLDVFESEAQPELKPVSEALIARPDVVTTPHAGASSMEGLARTNMVAARAVVAILDGHEPPPGTVIADGRTLAATA
ncbi:phosphoglycerate dehydrogenase [Sinorhizobium mexicanum]|uniref:Hydroxyacid dehydrogenase n=1 Tax=Sinorhizobium mexicanum TaxID=375549 RepID=A0A859QU90_9HYPH|nr:phosphoglycerate dehydrogenase [Sinorhizobium mexicanum]MBP1888088.1 D-3-phosphoglycerate dehydrogenase [Sinorhizobium mexicanum]QLL65697.1 hydroxyacid dehydrogenase [Sinorhizobium mexicanum]